MVERNYVLVHSSDDIDTKNDDDDDQDNGIGHSNEQRANFSQLIFGPSS